MDRAAFQRDLDELANRSRRFLARWYLQRDLRVTCRHAAVWMLAPAAGLLLIQLSLVFLAASTLAPRPWHVWLVIVAPAAYVATRVTWLHARRCLDRHGGLALYDQQLGAGHRLVTADEFLTTLDRVAEPQTRGFMHAALDDATPVVTAALATPLAPRPLPKWQLSSGSWVSALVAAILMGTAVWLDHSTRGHFNDDAMIAATTNAPSDDVTAANPFVQRPSGLSAARVTDHRSVDQPRTTPSSEPSMPASRGDRDAIGSSDSGGQANSRSSSRAATSSGVPSNQQRPSKDSVSDDQPASLSGDEARRAPKREAREDAVLTADATSGQGQSTSSSPDAHNIPAEERADRAGAQKEDAADEEGMQDEAEEEKTTGVERPMLRRTKPPVDRNLSPLPTGDQSSPLDNGRSGPGGRKKTRGVPSMILGVPIPDRMHGMTHPGRSKVTQESSTPKEEPREPAMAEPRQARDRPFGYIEHPVLSPWLQRVIEDYFVSLRERVPMPGAVTPASRVQGEP